ncbi:hypothetical protein AAES_114760 [Amazona aestiva]|uniref:Uncharacterized protein n=1 Tax=Amazona aestiva TaxID=12930 RepID=A0A0Q3M7K2_AMAAE|nr:hypothetical protein AAES_114760 [Amazona aestiva]
MDGGVRCDTPLLRYGERWASMMVSVPEAVSQTSHSSRRLIVQHWERGDGEADAKVSRDMPEPGWETVQSTLRKGIYTKSFSHFGLVTGEGRYS